MKKIVTLLFSLSLLLMLCSMSFVESSTGKLGYTNSPGEGNCSTSGCHNSFTANTGSGSVTIAAPGMTNWQYVPGQSYTINVTVAYAGRNLFGLGLEALRSTGANGGTLTAGTGTYTGNVTVSGNSRTNITHSQNGGASANSKTFSFTWVAPDASVGTVTFYCSGLCSDSNGGRTNDYVYTTSQAVTPLQAPAAPTINQPSTTTACTGTTIPLSVSAENGVTYAWFNASNTQVGTGATFNASVTGCYRVTATDAGGTTASTNEICVTISSPNAAFNAVPTTLCASAAPIALTPSQAGGTFSGPGVSGTQFNPATANVGSNTITYSITDGAGCNATSTQTIQVSAAVNGAFNTIPSSVCEDSPSINLVPTQSGGTFSGNGVSGVAFNPANAGVGDHVVTYSISNGACSVSTTQNITVNASPNAAFSGLTAQICSESEAVQLVPTTIGGTFSGPGVVANAFVAANAGAGTHEVVYTIQTGQGCTSSSSFSVEVSAAASADFAALASSYCSSEGTVSLVPVSAGGTFSGNGVEGAVMNVNNGSTGSRTVTYTVVSGACTSSTSQTVEVNSSPNASFVGLQPTYCLNSETASLIAEDITGVFAGPGIDGSSFDPALAGLGVHTISYTVEGSNGCSSQSSVVTEVVDVASSAFTGLNASYCTADEVSQLDGVQAGGVFTGTGVEGDVFNPTLAGAGEHIITYTVDFGSCSSTTDITTTVYTSPIAEFSGLSASHCLGDAPEVLTPVVEGGSFVGADAGVFNSVAEGTFEVSYTVTSDDGCATTSTQSTTVHPLPDATFTGLNPTYCLNDNATELIPATVGGTFTGSFENTFNPIIAGVGPHTVSYNITTEFGCSASWSATTQVNSLPIAALELINGSLVAAVNLNSYSWVNCTTGEVVIGETTNEYTPEATGSYSVTVSLNGCEITSECLPVEVSLINENNLLTRVYPNPASELLNVWSSTTGVLTLYTTTGELAGRWNVAVGNRVLYVGDLSRGAYLMHWKSGNTETTKTLILE
jgi:hypothetical protein